MANPNDTRSVRGALAAVVARASDDSSRATVATPSIAVREMSAHWELPHALMGGTMAMRAARDKYLPPNAVEQSDAYELRLGRSFLFNGYRDAVTGLASRPFGRPVNVGEKMAPELRDMASRVDSEGRGITQFAHDLMVWGIHEGLAHVLVDFPPAPEGGRTLADEQRDAVRPFWVLTPASSIVAWRSEVRGSEDQLTHLRVRELTTEPDGEWGEVSVERIRVYDRAGDGVSFRVFRKDSEGHWIQEGEPGRLTIGVIPLVTFYTRRFGFLQGRPALEDLAWLNLAHWQSLSEQRDLLSTARAGILFGKGFSEEEIGGKPQIGKKLWRVTSKDADLKWVEHTGAAMKVGQDDIDALEAKMMHMGLRPLVSKPGSQTATEKAIDTAESHRSLTQWVRNLEATLRGAFALSAQWRNQDPGEIAVDVAEDFGLSLEQRSEVSDLVSIWQAGGIRHETFLREVQRRGFFADGFRVEDELAALAVQPKDQMPPNS